MKLKLNEIRMKKIFAVLSLFILIAITNGCTRVEEASNEDLYLILKEASLDYQNGLKEKAREKYLIAVDLGSAEAKFQIASKYLVEDRERLNFLKEAASEGHLEALSIFIDETVFSAEETEPVEALRILNEAIKKNPNILNEEVLKEKKILEMGVEFIKHQLPVDVMNCISSNSCTNTKWELAEKYSSGLSENYDSKIIAALIVSSGGVPAEYKSAVEWAYVNHAKNLKSQFNICDHVTSGLTASYCSQRDNEILKNNIIENVNSKIKEFDDAEKSNILGSLNYASDYIESHVWNEVVTHTGSIRSAEAMDLESKLFNREAETVIKIADGWLPDEDFNLGKNEADLESHYINALKVAGAFEKYHMSEEFEGTVPPRIFPEGIEETQRKWEVYKTQMAEALHILNPRLSKNKWLAYLTKERAEFLKTITLDLEY